MKKKTANTLWSVLAIVAIAALIWSVVMLVSSRDERSDTSYAGEPISGYSVTDYSTVTETNSEGIKVDDDGFIPVSDDGGPIFLDPVSDDASAEEVEEAVCDAAHDLVTHRSRENRAGMFEYIKEHEQRIEFESLRDAVANLSGYDFNNPTIEPVLVQCK